ncbi:MAG: GDSL-type esterase/lipase family protein [Myxococcota bacterium]|nr:GDSL-type esterase/lipase family protein [Myxococcota bacterium]
MKALRFALLSLVTTALAAQAQEYPERVGPPSALAAVGDSISTGFNASTTRFGNQPYHSWSTGSDGGVVSQYTQLGELGGAPVAYSLAVAGAVMGDLASQVNNAIARRTADGGTVDYVTLLMGANDVCRGSEAAMLEVDTFRQQFAGALDSLSAGLPDARIFVASIPDVFRLWEVLHTDANAVYVWDVANTCQSVLANPESTAAADEERRARVRQRVVDFNQQLAEVCDGSLHCRHDQGAVFEVAFLASEVSTLDYFHPSVTGQSRVGSVTWTATFDFTDVIAPVSTAEIVPSGSEDLITLSSTDDVAVRGIEFHVTGDSRWARYDVPLSLSEGATLVFRAVDINGNIEAAQQYRRGGPLPADGGTGTDAGTEPDAGVQPIADGGTTDDTPEGGCSCGSGGFLPVAAFALLGMLRLGDRRRRLR